jgi:hypothetical protein
MKQLIILFFILCSCFIFSQERPGFYLLVGACNSSLKTKAITVENDNIGYVAGIGVFMGHDERFSWQMELAYLNSPISLKATDDKFYKYNFSNFQSGIYLTYNIFESEENKFYFGPQLGIGFDFGAFNNASDEYSNELIFVPEGVDEMTLHNDTSILNTNLVLGINATYTKFKVNLRYTIGLSNVFDGVATTNYTDSGAQAGNTLSEGKINALSLILSYKLSRF